MLCQNMNYQFWFGVYIFDWEDIIYNKWNMREVKQQEIIKDEIKLEKYFSQHSASYEPIIPAAKVSPEVIQILRTTKVPELIIPNHTTIPGAAKIYFQQYLKLFSQNRQLNAALIETFQSRNRLAEKYNQLKRQQNDFEDTIRRKRRFANQIKRDFSCPSPNCHKSYGSEGSLTQHVKLKHEGFYKSGEYQILLQRMLDDMSMNNEHGRVKQQDNQKAVKVKTEKIQKQQQTVKNKQEQT